MIIKILFQSLILFSLIFSLPITPPVNASPVQEFSPTPLPKINNFSVSVKLIAQTETFLPELSGKREAYKKTSIQGGFAEAKVNFFREGMVLFETRANSDSKVDDVKAAVFAVGSDMKGRSLFVSPNFEIPRACSKIDICSSNRTKNFEYQLDNNLARYVDEIDVFVNTRWDAKTLREKMNQNLADNCGTYDDFPPKVRIAIAEEAGFPSCRP